MSVGDEFWNLVYGARQYLWLFLFYLLFMFVLSVFGIYFSNPGTASQVIAYINIAVILVVGAIAATMFWYSTKRYKNR
jgi:hypothetical protein